MLILERKLNQAIIIQTPSGENIEIQIQELRRTRAKLGVHAPDDYFIIREEMLDDDIVDECTS